MVIMVKYATMENIYLEKILPISMVGTVILTIMAGCIVPTTIAPLAIHTWMEFLMPTQQHDMQQY